MPPPAKVLRPPAPATAQPLVELTTAPTTSGAPARPTAGNAAVAAALGGTWPPGQVERMLAGQGLVGNAATAALGGRTGILPALPGTAPPVPAPAVPAPPAPSRTVPAPAGRAEPEPAAPGTKKPETKKPAEPKPGAIKAKPPPVPVPGVKEKDEAPQPAKEKSGGKATATARRSPGADPKFQALKKDVGAKKRAVGSSHPPASTEATAAQAAAVPPADDQEARGKAAHAEDMDAAEPKEFDKEAFVRAVEKAISDRAPKNLDEADGFGESGKAEEVKAEVQGKVGEGKDTAAEDIASTTAQPPEPAPDDKPVTPLSPDQPPGRPGGPDPGQAVPDKLPSSATDMSAGPEQVDRQMADAQVTETQLAKSNEPAFTGALTEKKSMEAHSATTPGELRGAEGQEIKQGRAAAAATGPKAMGAIHTTRVSTGKQVGAGKGKAKGSDEEKRATVTALLQKVFDQTKTDVEKILKDLDKAVDDQFTAGEKQARTRFVLEHTTGMRRYKAERYGGWDGPFLWGRDLFKGLPDEANQIYERAKANYLTAMRQVIRDIAGTVERELRRAKDRIAEGRTQLATAVDQLPKDLKAIGQEAATDFAAKFDELKDTVDDKGTELVDTLATRYTDAVKEIDKLIAAEKEKNKGLVDKVVDAVKGVINTIIELKNMLMGVLRKAVQAIGLILRDPIGFLGNLVKAVGGGLKLFMKNIGRHLQQGVLGWLLGTASSAGIQIPAKFDVRGVLQIITGLLGLTKENVLARISRKTSPRAVAAVEKSVPVLAQVKRQGVMGMWDDLKSRVGDLKKNLIDNLIKYLTPTIVIAGITWILSLLNPASAFVRAVKMIIDIVRFIITQGRQIIAFVNAVLDAVIAIAGGGGGGVPAMVEGALARSIPILIGALAAILGIGGIAGKVRQIFQQMSRPVNRAIDQVVDKIVGLVKKLWAKLKPKPAKKKPKKPDHHPRRNIRRPPRRTRGAAPHRRPPRTRPVRRSKTTEDKSSSSRLAAAIRSAQQLMKSPKSTTKSVRQGLGSIQKRFKLTSIKLEKLTGHDHKVVAQINPKLESDSRKIPSPEELQAIRTHAQRIVQLWQMNGVGARFQQAGRSGRRSIILDSDSYRRPGGREDAPVISVGDLVEAVAEPGLRRVATAIGGTLLVNPTIFLSDASGNPLGGQVDELDFLLMGPREVRVVSAKVNRRQFRRMTDERKLNLIRALPDNPAAGEFVAQYMGWNDRTRLLERAQAAGAVVQCVGLPPVRVSDFRARYLSREQTRSITIEPAYPAHQGDTQAGDYTLRMDLADLIELYIHEILRGL
jgi:hypothetical protein